MAKILMDEFRGGKLGRFTLELPGAAEEHHEAEPEIDLWAEERRLWQRGCGTICGADEAGAGPLAGPVYAAAVILPREAELPGLNDSKKLSPSSATGCMTRSWKRRCAGR